MRYKVPQNIDMPDRILGPLTMLQFVYAVIGGGLAYSAYMSLPSPLSMFLAILIALLTLAMIFLKINERSFSHFILSFFQFLSSPRSRTWKKEGSSNNLNVEIYKQRKTEGPRVARKEIRADQISELAKRIDNS